MKRYAVAAGRRGLAALVCCGLAICFFALGPPASAQIPRGDITIKLEPVAAGLTAPIYATHAGDGSGRLFIVEQSGQIRIVRNGVLLPVPFLDIAAKLPALNPGFDERGLLGLAFHPDYETNGRFFVRYSAPRTGAAGEPCFGTSRGCHKEVLAEYSVSATDPNLADPASESILFTIDEPQFNHDGGHVEFGPDGFLYFSLGDGGGAHDGLADSPPSHGPTGHGQNIDTALGALLRIDVDNGSPYAIPPDNPFAGGAGLDEIYAYGMRNPYRFSFDDGPGGDGRLFLADVGQNLFEEVNIVVNGGNYGWVIREGLHCFDPFNPTNPPANCPSTGARGEPLLDPIVEYSHAEGGLTVIGGHVYRGRRSSRGLDGKYVFGDFSAAFQNPSGRLYFLVEPAPNDFEIREFRIGRNDEPYGLFLKGFGEDENGEIYTCGSSALAPFGTTGLVERIVVVPTPALDIAPGSCPNPLNRGSRGKMTVALLGTATFDVSQVDLSTLALVRETGSVAPTQITTGDVGSPFAGEVCGCHEGAPDGIADLVLKFDTQQVVSGLGLASAALGEFVPLTLRGRLSPATGPNTITYTFGLDGSQEVPPSGSAGSGSCSVALNTVSGAVSVSCTYAGLTGNATAAHIHAPASPGANASVIVPLVQTGGTSGVITGGGTLTPAQLQATLAGLAYVNLHSTAFPGGELRGQIAEGESFAASDCVRIVPPGRGFPPTSPIDQQIQEEGSGLPQLIDRSVE